MYVQWGVCSYGCDDSEVGEVAAPSSRVVAKDYLTLVEVVT